MPRKACHAAPAVPESPLPCGTAYLLNCHAHIMGYGPWGMGNGPRLFLMGAAHT